MLVRKMLILEVPEEKVTMVFRSYLNMAKSTLASERTLQDTKLTLHAFEVARLQAAQVGTECSSRRPSSQIPACSIAECRSARVEVIAKTSW